MEITPRVTSAPAGEAASSNNPEARYAAVLCIRIFVSCAGSRRYREERIRAGARTSDRVGWDELPGQRRSTSLQARFQPEALAFNADGGRVRRRSCARRAEGQRASP